MLHQITFISKVINNDNRSTMQPTLNIPFEHHSSDRDLMLCLFVIHAVGLLCKKVIQRGARFMSNDVTVKWTYVLYVKI